jgi:hypothetical protein
MRALLQHPAPPNPSNDEHTLAARTQQRLPEQTRTAQSPGIVSHAENHESEEPPRRRRARAGGRQDGGGNGNGKGGAE